MVKTLRNHILPLIVLLFGIAFVVVGFVLVARHPACGGFLIGWGGLLNILPALCDLFDAEPLKKE